MKSRERIFTIIKYAFSLIFTLLAFTEGFRKKYLLAQLMELGIIFLFSNYLLRKKRVAGLIVNALLLILYHLQIAFLLFGNSYLTNAMITNVHAVRMLGGKAVVYIGAALLLVAASALPAGVVSFRRLREPELLSLVLALELAFTFVFGNTYSPMYAYADLAGKVVRTAVQRRQIASIEDAEASFYREEVPDEIAGPPALPEKPDIALLFTEGLSQNIIDDERDIMPRIRAYQERSVNFINYYNHTFATYRGLIGQLYSGYQLDDFDTNSLVSMQQILGDLGYETVLINTEPHNAGFTSYLNSLGFDTVLDVEGTEEKRVNGTCSDREAYEALYRLMTEREPDAPPLFAVLYTVGTHVTLYSTDEVYEGGTAGDFFDKFYNLDYQFASFVEQMEASERWEDTVVVFTADHATFADEDFTRAFPDYPRKQGILDSIPFFIYHAGVEAKTVDAGGRNTLCLAPTVLDYLDVNAPNYFLGSSLFAPLSSDITPDTVYHDPDNILSSKYGIIRPLIEEESAVFQPLLELYLAAKLH